MHDRGEDRVQVHGREPAHQHHEDVEDAGEGERQGGRDHEATEDVVQVDESLTDHRLREDEQEHDAQHGTDWRQRRADEPEEVRQGEGSRQGADHDQKPHPLLGRPRPAALAAKGQRPEAGRDQPEHVEHDGAPHEAVFVLRREHEDHHRDHQDARDSNQRRALLSLGYQHLEQVHRKLRQQYGQHGCEPHPDLGAHEVVRPLSHVPKADVRGERGKE